MDFAFSEEQDALRDAARQWLADRLPLDRVAALADSDAGWDPSSWGVLSELGWLDDELGPLEHAVLLEETGRALYPGPLFSTVALARPAGYRGEGPATLAYAEYGAPARLAAGATVGCLAEPAGVGWRLHGRKSFVPDVAAATSVVVVATAAHGLGLWEVDLAGAAAAVVPLSTTDRTRRLGDLLLDATPARLLVPPGEAPAVLAEVRREARAALACEAVGVAARCLDIAAGHARDRQQFGRPIGSYQAVSHRVADVYVALSLARSLAYWASWCVAERDPAVDAACAAAKAAASEAAVLAAEGAIQVLGGLGFTWESPVHRLYKRAQWIAAFDGAPTTQRAQIADALLGAT